MSEFIGFNESLIIGGRDMTVGIKEMEGVTRAYNLTPAGTLFGDTVVKTFNAEGPLPEFHEFTGTTWPAIGWAIAGAGGNDVLQGYSMADWLAGETGNDVLRGMGGRDYLEGDENDDQLYGGNDGDWLFGGTGKDSLYGDAGADKLNGGAGDDWMNGGAGIDTMDGGQGNDGYRITFGDADVIIEIGGAGTDTVYLDRGSYMLGNFVENMVVDAATTSNTNLMGNGWVNVLTGAQGADVLNGMGGTDDLNGGGGGDWLYGGNDADRLYGGAGNDKLYGDSGDDSMDGGAGSDLMAGGAGNDTYLLEDATDGVVEGTDIGTDTIQSLLQTTTLSANVENLKMMFVGGSTGYGNALTNEMTGSIWNDYMDGGAGTDWLYGNLGHDTLLGGDDNDFVAGEFGSDVLYGGLGIDAVEGGEGVDWVYGGDGNDGLKGGTGDDFVYGGTGSDRIEGEAGNDRLWGGDAADQIYGGAGNDQIRGEGGSDKLYGDAGADRFIFASVAESTVTSYDRVMDFVRGTDKIDLSLIDADNTVTGNQAFSFAGAKPFFASAGDLYVTTGLIGSVVEGDVNGDGISDFRVVLTAVYDVAASDFIL